MKINFPVFHRVKQTTRKNTAFFTCIHISEDPSVYIDVMIIEFKHNILRIIHLSYMSVKNLIF